MTFKNVSVLTRKLLQPCYRLIDATQYDVFRPFLIGDLNIDPLYGHKSYHLALIGYYIKAVRYIETLLIRGKETVKDLANIFNIYTAERVKDIFFIML